MTKTVTITLEVADIFQIINALESRVDAYEKTAELLKDEHEADRDSEVDSEMDSEDLSDEFFIAEECKDASEAEEIASHFRDIITSLERQIGGAR